MMVVGIVVRWGCGQGQLRATCFGGHIDAMYHGYTMKEVLSRFLSCWWTYHNVGSFPPMRKTDYSQDVLIANFLLATVDERMYVFGNGPCTKVTMYVCMYCITHALVTVSLQFDI